MGAELYNSIIVVVIIIFIIIVIVVIIVIIIIIAIIIIIIILLLLLLLLILFWPGSFSGKALDYALDGPRSNPGVGGVEVFLHSFVSRQVLESTQPPIKWVPGAFPRS